LVCINKRFKILNLFFISFQINLEVNLKNQKQQNSFKERRERNSSNETRLKHNY